LSGSTRREKGDSTEKKGWEWKDLFVQRTYITENDQETREEQLVGTFDDGHKPWDTLSLVKSDRSAGIAFF
jgi:hypothetical protein